MRGSDPDAALYWLAKMLYAGEDPRFILRRRIDSSPGKTSAWPILQAVAVVSSVLGDLSALACLKGRFPLAQAALYLATAPKSNSTLAFFDAWALVQREREECPTHLKDGNRDKEGFGHGEGYLYPHTYREHWVAQQYLPKALQGRTFDTEPSDQGYERAIGTQVARRRVQLRPWSGRAPLRGPDLYTGGRYYDRWLQRTVSNAGERLGRLRDRECSPARTPPCGAGC